MQLVERHLIRQHDARFALIDQAAFASKNLYNQANYHVRQAFLHEGTYLPYPAIFHRLKHHDAYCALPRKVSNAILIALHHNWRGFFEGMKAYRQDPTAFIGRPKIPGYLDKTKGRFLLVYEKKALGKRAFKRTGTLVPSGLPIEIATQLPWEVIRQVRIIARADGYMVEVVYEREIQPAAVNPALRAAVDVGVNVLAAITSDKPGFVPRLVSGKPLKSLNQGYNKERAKQQQRLAHEKRWTSRHLDRVTTKRNRRVDGYLHTASRRIIDLLVSEGIGTLVIGKNPLWKQEVRLGRRNNQQFVQLPHARFLEQLTYKAQLVGIRVILQEESYTSKASYPDGDPIPSYEASAAEKQVFSGKRVARSWYRAGDGRLIHADLNGSYNILRKSSSDPLQVGRGVAGAAVLPRRLAV
ncbi:RNA-guided endonuclease InsQ/TnpB family protein [Ktedonospora formicarum]|uniref:Transposase n=1 Tax=Ktedonospora formicarum TaxID=2778364 RepID=A0A8J3IBU1_9CHLR|nr:RNA-guided endonuclease TnpB family protein [Ktedonospora formicarum]GHO50400.1 transposase [Ktedonospora formicarum]GHO50446.1 transposase [Ktedonospora formicarum]